MPQTDKGYTGQQRDDTGLLWYQSRFYDPNLGRFLSADTIVPGSGALTIWPSDSTASASWSKLKDGGPANPQELNRYSYVNNNPLGATDPTGHCGDITDLAGDCPGENKDAWTAGGSSGGTGSTHKDAANEVEAVVESVEVTAQKVVSFTESIARDVQSEVGGIVGPAKGDGWTNTLPRAAGGGRDIVARIMNSGGGRTEPYIRVSIEGKTSFAKDGSPTNDRFLSHIPIKELSDPVHTVVSLIRQALNFKR